MKRITLTLGLILACIAASCGSDGGSVDLDASANAEPTAVVADDSGEEPDDDGASAVPADDTLDAPPYPIATLEFVVTHPELDELRYTLSCEGDAAGLSGNWEPVVTDELGPAHHMCLILADSDVSERLVIGADELAICTQNYGGADEAAVTGDLDDNPIQTLFDRTNGCGISEWDAMGNLLPESRGI